MLRRNFLEGFSLLTGAGLIGANRKREENVIDTRRYWLEKMVKVASPVLTSLSNHSLKAVMPVESLPGTKEGRMQVTYLEAFGRTLAGISPWLENTDVPSSEKAVRERFVELSVASIRNAVTPTSKSYMNFTRHNQPLVDAAFLAHALLRAPKQLWGNLDDITRSHVVAALRSTRAIKPYYSNWLLFSAMIEAALLKFDDDYDPVRIDYAIKQHQSWYKGDGVYGDGPEFHFDYYNSYVIHPMMVDIMRTLLDQSMVSSDELLLIVKRAQRYAAIQERMISPEGTFPVVGRSLAYRCGAFQLLAQMALQKTLPTALKPGQVRMALTAVIERTLDAPGTFDDHGWLTIGLCGHQPGVGESYISTGSLYLCSTVFLPMGLPANDSFWSSPPEDWTSKKAFSGKEFPIDEALK